MLTIRYREMDFCALRLLLIIYLHPSRSSLSIQIMVQLLATKMVTAAAIAGHDGNIWAQSAGFNVTPDEVKKVLGSWDNASAMGMSGVTFNGLRSQKLPF